MEYTGAMRQRSGLLIIVAVVICCFAAAQIALPDAGPLCCGGSSQVGRFGKLLAVRAESGALVVWDAWTQRRWVVPVAGTGATGAAAGGNAVVWLEPKGVMVGDMHTGDILPLAEAAGVSVSLAMVSADARFVAISGLDHHGEGIWLIDRNHGTRTLISGLPDGARMESAALLAISGDGRYTAYRHNGSVFVFDVFRGASRSIWPKRT